MLEGQTALQHWDKLSLAALYGLRLVYLFAAIGFAAYDFLCPNLHSLSIHTGLDESVIGVTFIALGNGSVDVVSAFVAINSGNIQLAVGSIVGASLFIICVVIGALGVTAPAVVRKRSFLRDSGFLIIAISLVMYSVYIGRVTLVTSLIMIAWYALYAFVVIRFSKTDTSREEEFSHAVNIMHLFPDFEPGTINTPIRTSLLGLLEHPSTRDNSRAGTPDYEHRHDFSEESRYENHGPPSYWPTTHTIPSANSRCSSVPTLEVDPVLLQEETAKSCRPLLRVDCDIQEHNSPNSTENILQLPTGQGELRPESALSRSRSPSTCSITTTTSSFIIKRRIDKHGLIKAHIFPAFLDWEDQTWAHKITTILMAPVLISLSTSIPIPVHDSEYMDRDLLTIHSVVSPLVLYVLCFTHDSYGLFLTCTLIVCFLLMARTMRIPALLSTFFGFIMGVVWVVGLADQVVNVVVTLGESLGISKAVLGLTVVAVGNSIGDLVSNVSIAKKNYSTMALSACFGSPLFTMLIGIGGSCLLVMLLGKTKYITVDRDFSVITACSLLLITILFLVSSLPLTEWRMTSRIGLFCIAVWILSVLTNLELYIYQYT